MQALGQHLGSRLFRALVQVLNTLRFKRIFGKDSPNRFKTRCKESLEAGSLTEALLRCPAAQQVLVQDAGEAKVGP
jgi:hypothetical protein